ncbi:MAG: type I pullulanase [Planctomycetes bacterium]|nr:type I pullulanase [Planctomycetota bacterium]
MRESRSIARSHRAGRFALVLAMALSGVAAIFAAKAWAGNAAESSAQAGKSPRIAESLKAKYPKSEGLLVVHYARADKKYDRWNLWCWPQGGEGASYPFTGKDGFGRYAVIPFDKLPKEAGFLVRLGDWESKDIEHDRSVKFDAGSTREVWLVAGDDHVYADPEIDQSLRVTGAFLDSDSAITLATSAPLSKEQTQKAQIVRRDKRPGAPKITGIAPSHESGTSRSLYTVKLAKPVADADIAALQIEIPGAKPQTLYARNILDQERFTPLQAHLGAFCTPEKTDFQTWSPVSSGVQLLFYDSVDAKQPSRSVPLQRGEKGLWNAEVPGDLQGKLYRYRFDSYGEQREVPDIHTFAATADGSFSVVADLNRLSPKEWESTAAPILKHPTDEIIYEVHVRDFSIADSACPTALRGTYLGLTQESAAKGGMMNGGLSHLKELGVTAVHLLPIEDFSAAPKEYNWGYWTAFFNVPESNYSSDDKDPLQPIREVKSMVQGLHAAGLRVILDVVYNHTSSTGTSSPFDQTVPFYFHRTADDGHLMDDTGVGNAVADERPMVRKYIVDSLAHWLTNYKVDGFRFDLLGTHYPETVKAICDRLVALKPDITLYGEPWTGGGVTHFGKGAQKGMRIGVFNDNIRNAVRGDLDGTTTGFATGPGGDAAALKRGVIGSIDDFTLEPGESVNYVAAHDNLTLWDKLLKAQPSADDATRRAMQKMALGIVLTSQGIAFLDEGSDFCRTKNGNHNSYNAGDEVNALDWKRKMEYRDVFDYVSGLVALRREHPAFRMGDNASVRKSVKFLDNAGTVSFTINGSAAGDSWRDIFVAYNGEPRTQQVTLPPGAWTVVVDAKQAGTERLRLASGLTGMPAYSMMVAYKN